MPYKHKKTIYDKIKHEAGIWNYEFGNKLVELSDQTLIECQAKLGSKDPRLNRRTTLNFNVTWRELKATSSTYFYGDPAYFKYNHPVYNITDPYGLVEWLYKEQLNKSQYELCALDSPRPANIEYWLQ